MRTNLPSKDVSVLIEFVVVMKSNMKAPKRLRKRLSTKNGDGTDAGSKTIEMTCCWCKVPLDRLIVTKDVVKLEQELLGGTVFAPVPIDQVGRISKDIFKFVLSMYRMKLCNVGPVGGG